MIQKFKSTNEQKPAYLFVHFKEKTTPDGEQVYFALSRDGFTWESVNRGLYYGHITEIRACVILPSRNVRQQENIIYSQPT